MEVLFYLSEERIILINQLVGKKEQQVTEFDWEEFEALEKVLQGLPRKVHIGIVLDFIDEMIDEYWIPKLMPWEKPALEKRYESRAKASGALMVAVAWAKEYQTTSAGRQEQRLRVLSLTGSESLKRLIIFLENGFFTVSKIYSASYLIEGFFLSNVRPKFKFSKQQLTTPLLLLVREGQHLFRQVVLKKNNILLTRLIEIDKEVETEDAIAYALIDEANLSVKYLYNQKILPYNTEVGLFYLDVSLEMAEKVKSIFMDRIATSRWQKDKIILASSTFDKVASQSYLQHQSTSFFTALSSYILDKKPTETYQTPYTKKIGQFLSARKLLIFSTLATIVIGGILNGQQLINLLVTEEQNKVLQQKYEHYQFERNKISKTLNTTQDPQNMQEIVLFSQKVLSLKQKNRLGFNLVELSQILEASPHIQLMEMNWHNLGKFDQTRVALELKGLVFPFVETYQKPVQWVDELVEQLRQLQGVQTVDLVKEPLNRDLSTALTIKKTVVNALPFEIQMTLGTAPSPSRHKVEEVDATLP